jgi:hypothetical protein
LTSSLARGDRLAEAYRVPAEDSATNTYVSKKSRSHKRQRKTKARNSSRLDEHQRHRKVLTPPLLNFPNMTPFDWRLRQPDMLLMAALLDSYPGDWRVVDALEALDDFVPKGEPRIIDGRLTQLEIVPRRMRPAARRALIARDPAVLPDELGHALSLFEDCPGSWIYELGVGNGTRTGSR